jgi:hypothetical protein
MVHAIARQAGMLKMLFKSIIMVYSNAVSTYCVSNVSFRSTGKRGAAILPSRFAGIEPL